MGQLKSGKPCTHGKYMKGFAWELVCEGWLLLPLHHLCGFLACYGNIESFWCFNGRLNYYLNHLAPFCAGPRRSWVAQCHQGVLGGVPKPSYSLLSWVQRCVAKVNTIHWLLDDFQLNRRFLLTSSWFLFPNALF